MNKHKIPTRLGAVVPSSGSYFEQRSKRPTRSSRYCVAILNMIKILKYENFRIHLANKLKITMS
jgi:hypothetical protein